MVPQNFQPCSLQVLGWQVPGSGAHTPGVLPGPPQTEPAAQPPQSSRPPQPSPTLPQRFPPACSHVSFWQLESGGGPHTFATRPPHTWPSAQPPHSKLPPQPLPTRPQNLPPACSHVIGVHEGSGGPPHTLLWPAPPQVKPSGQPPQSRAPPQPSPMRPQYLPPACSHVTCVVQGGASAASRRLGNGAKKESVLASPALEPPRPPLPPAPSSMYPGRVSHPMSDSTTSAATAKACALCRGDGGRNPWRLARELRGGRFDFRLSMCFKLLTANFTSGHAERVAALVRVSCGVCSCSRILKRTADSPETCKRVTL